MRKCSCFTFREVSNGDVVFDVLVKRLSTFSKTFTDERLAAAKVLALTKLTVAELRLTSMSDGESAHSSVRCFQTLETIVSDYMLPVAPATSAVGILSSFPAPSISSFALSRSMRARMADVRRTTCAPLCQNSQ